MTKHKIGTRKEWLAARLELLQVEKELTRRSSSSASGSPRPNSAKERGLDGLWGMLREIREVESRSTRDATFDIFALATP